MSDFEFSDITRDREDPEEEEQTSNNNNNNNNIDTINTNIELKDEETIEDGNIRNSANITRSDSRQLQTMAMMQDIVRIRSELQINQINNPTSRTGSITISRNTENDQLQSNQSNQSNQSSNSSENTSDIMSDEEFAQRQAQYFASRYYNQPRYNIRINSSQIGGIGNISNNGNNINNTTNINHSLDIGQRIVRNVNNRISSNIHNVDSVNDINEMRRLRSSLTNENAVRASRANIQANMGDNNQLLNQLSNQSLQNEQNRENNRVENYSENNSNIDRNVNNLSNVSQSNTMDVETVDHEIDLDLGFENDDEKRAS